jgi:hypothetical protein
LIIPARPAAASLGTGISQPAHATDAATKACVCDPDTEKSFPPPTL